MPNIQEQSLSSVFTFLLTKLLSRPSCSYVTWTMNLCLYELEQVASSDDIESDFKTCQGTAWSSIPIHIGKNDATVI